MEPLEAPLRPLEDDDFGLRFNSIDSITTNLDVFRTLESFVRDLLDKKAHAARLYSEHRYHEAYDCYHAVLHSMQDLHRDFRNHEEFISTATNVLLIYKEAHLNLSLCLVKQGEYLRAVETLEKLLGYDPGSAKALYLRGKCLLACGRYSEALADLEEAKALKPGSYEVIDRYLEQARLLQTNKQIPTA